MFVFSINIILCVCVCVRARARARVRVRVHVCVCVCVCVYIACWPRALILYFGIQLIESRQEIEITARRNHRRSTVLRPLARNKRAWTTSSLTYKIERAELSVKEAATLARS